MEIPNGRTARTPDGFAQAFCDNLVYSRGQAVQSASAFDGYMALAYTVRDHLIDRWRKTTESQYRSNPKFVYYLSAEYMLGRQLQQTFAYTCHTLLPEALEKWPVGILQYLLPRHLELIFEINQRLLEEVRAHFPFDAERTTRMSTIEEEPRKLVRMAHLAVVGSHSTNGVAALHSHLLKEGVFHDFYALWPERFNNKTNGVTPRRFVKMANPRLSDLITSVIGDSWLCDLDEPLKLEPYADNPQFRATWRAVKYANKQALSNYIHANNGIQVDPSSIFDIMVKRLHEYKRQILKALHIVTLYNRLTANPKLAIVPRTFVFGARRRRPGITWQSRSLSSTIRLPESSTTIRP